MTQKQLLKESVELIEKMINGSAWYIIPQYDKSKGKKLIDAYNKIKRDKKGEEYDSERKSR